MRISKESWMKHLLVASLVSCAFLALLVAEAPAVNANGSDGQNPRWVENAIFYQIMPDRFRNGNPNNDPVGDGQQGGQDDIILGKMPDYNQNRYAKKKAWTEDIGNEIGNEFYGGDFQGVQEKISYLEDLGITGIYFNPVMDGPHYHGYTVRNYKSVMRYFGCEDIQRDNVGWVDYGPQPVWNESKKQEAVQTFEDLVEDLHQSDIRTIIDGVFNYVSADSKYFDIHNRFDTQGAYESQDSKWYDWFEFGGDWPNGYQNYCYRDMTYAPELQNTEEVKDAIYRGLNSVLDFWDEIGVDGWRLDLAMIIKDRFGYDFWKGFSNNYRDVNSDGYLIVEPQHADTWDSDMTKYMSEGGMDGVMNYPWRDAVVDWVDGGSPSNFDSRLNNIVQSLPDNESLYTQFNMLSTHDEPRILTKLRGDKEGERLAVIFQMTYPGVPCVYYGDEVGMLGRTYVTRRPYPWPDEDYGVSGSRDMDLFNHYEKLIDIRKSNPVLSRGSLETLKAGEGIYALGRKLGDDYAVTVYNNGSGSQEVTLDLSGLGVPDGTKLVDVFNGDQEYTVSGGQVTTTVDGMWANVLISTAGDFSISSGSSSGTVTQGGEQSVQIDIGESGGYGEEVSLSATGVPDGVDVSFSNNDSVPPFSSEMEMSVGAGAATGRHSLTIVAHGRDGKSHELDYSLTILESGFSMSVSPGSGQVNTGEVTTASLSLESTGNYSSEVNLSSETPEGIDVSFGTNDEIPPFTSEITISVSTEVDPGTYTIVISAEGTDGTTRQYDFELVVGEIVGNFGINLEDDNGRIQVGGSTTVGLQVTDNDYSEPVSLSVEGAPEGLSCSFSANDRMPPFESNLTFRAGSQVLRAPNLISPENNAELTNMSPTFEWSESNLENVGGVQDGIYSLTIRAEGVGIYRQESYQLVVGDEEFPQDNQENHEQEENQGSDNQENHEQEENQGFEFHSPEVTNDSEVRIHGNTYENHRVVVYLNDTIYDVISSGENGYYETNIENLRKGNNSVYLKVLDENNEELYKSGIYSINYSSEDNEVNVSEPSETPWSTYAAFVLIGVVAVFSLLGLEYLGKISIPRGSLSLGVLAIFICIMVLNLYPLEVGAGSGDITYHLQIDDSPSFSSPVVEESGLLSTDYTLDSELSSGTYYWRVRAESGSMKSSWSEMTKFTISVEMEEAPGKPILSSPGDGLVLDTNNPSFEWTPGENADEHYLWIDNDYDFSSLAENKELGSSAGSYTLQDPLSEGSYYWKVVAVNPGGRNNSEVRSFEIQLPEPGTPILQSPADKARVETKNPVLEWGRAENAETYQVVLDDNSDFNSPLVEDNGLSDTSYSLTTDLSDGSYWWRARARSSAGKIGGWSDNFSFTVDTKAPPPEDNEFDNTDIVYQIMVDRFYNGNPSNDNQGAGEYDPDNLWFYHGGDWQGIIDKLDYIDNLGVTTIWISSPCRAQWMNKGGTSAGYHGYWTKDYWFPDPHWGTLSKIKTFIDEAHDRGISVVTEAIPNHTGDFLNDDTFQYTDNYTPAPPFDNSDWYHEVGPIKDWQDPYQVKNGELHGSDKPWYGLDDLDQSKEAVEEELLEVYNYWLDNVGFDGYRADASKHMKDWFLDEFQENIGVPCFGEAWYGGVSDLADHWEYQSEGHPHLWGVHDFPFAFAMRDVFMSGGDFSRISDILSQDSTYEAFGAVPNHMLTFLDSHDMSRFMEDSTSQNLRLALSFLLTVRGVPTIYYGTAQEMTGAGDPYNRKDMVGWDSTDTYKHIQRLTTIRKNYAPLYEGEQIELLSGSDVYAYRRVSDDEEVIVVLNNSYSQQDRTIDLSGSNLTDGTELINLLDTDETVTVSSGEISVTLDSKGAMVLASTNKVGSYTPPSPEPSSGVTTKIRVHYDAGYGNSIYIRGDTYPLNWNSGIEATWTEGNVWVWETDQIPEGQSFEYKPLINDETWANDAGPDQQNYIGTGGQTMDISPAFD